MSELQKNIVKYNSINILIVEEQLHPRNHSLNRGYTAQLPVPWLLPDHHHIQHSSTPPHIAPVLHLSYSLASRSS